MKLFGFELTLQKQIPSTLQPVDSRGSSSWWWGMPRIHEPWPGAWQQNVSVTVEDVTAYFAVFACATLIASDVAKMRVKLVQKTEDGIWEETENPAFSPVLRKPNHYQTRIQFFESWMLSLLLRGNTYVLKVRDNRNVVTDLYVLDPNRVRVHVAGNGEVFYELLFDNLSQLDRARSIFGNLIESQNLFVPASEIIHDRINTLFHPLVGMSPIYACGLAALQGLKIQNNSYHFFANGSIPGAVITTKGPIAQAAADRIRDYVNGQFTGANAGKIMILSDGMEYHGMTVSAVDSELIEQLKMTALMVCACFHVPPYMIGIPPLPPYNNIEALNAQYYAQAVQKPLEGIELALDEGLGLDTRKDPKEGESIGTLYGTEFELDDLLRMDTATLVKTEAEKVRSGIGTPNESRLRLNAPPVKGGDTPYLQQQNYSLAALDERDSNDPFSKPTQGRLQPAQPPPQLTPQQAAKLLDDIVTKLAEIEHAAA